MTPADGERPRPRKPGAPAARRGTSSGDPSGRPPRPRDGGRSGDQPPRTGSGRPLRARGGASGSGSGSGSGRPARSAGAPRIPRDPADRPYRPRTSGGSASGTGRPARSAGAPRIPRDPADRPYRPRTSDARAAGAGTGRPTRARDDRPPRAGGAPAARTGRPTRDRRDDTGIGSEARRAVQRGRADDRDRTPVRKDWGGVARRGARDVGGPRDETASKAWRDAVDRERAAPTAWEPEVWVKEPDADAPPPRSAPGPSPRPVRRQREPRLPAPVKEELGKANRKLAPKLEQRLAEAVRAYERDRYQDARRILRPLAESTPDSPAIRELHGLTLYRMNRWPEALRELNAFHALSGSYDQHPVLMDASRALNRWRRVDELWEELRAASPGADIVAEGRIVAAGALADRGRLAEAIGLLEKASTDVKRPKLHHLRTWYALADLYEKAGEVPRARTLFNTVLRHDREFADVAERLSALG